MSTYVEGGDIVHEVRAWQTKALIRVVRHRIDDASRAKCWHCRYESTSHRKDETT